MTDAKSQAIFLITALCIVNLLVTALVIRSRYFSATQKSAQCAIVWLVPLLGSIAIRAFLRTQECANVFDTRTYTDGSQKMIGPEGDSAIRESSGTGGGAD